MSWDKIHNEAIERLQKTKVNDWGGSLAMESDFTDLYSNCNISLLKKYVKGGAITKQSQIYQ